MVFISLMIALIVATVVPTAVYTTVGHLVIQGSTTLGPCVDAADLPYEAASEYYITSITQNSSGTGITNLIGTTGAKGQSGLRFTIAEHAHSFTPSTSQYHGRYITHNSPPVLSD